MTEEETIVIPNELPVLALRDVVVFPYMIIPLVVGRDISNAAIDAAMAGERMVAVITQKDMDIEEPRGEDLFTVGTACTIMRMVKLTEERVKVLVQGVAKVRTKKFKQERPFLRATVEIIQEPEAPDETIENEANQRAVVEGLQKISQMGKSIPNEVVELAETVDDPGRLADIVASNLSLKIAQAQEVLETVDPQKRLELVREHLARELALLEAQAKIETMAKEGIHKSQREYYLREQMKAIRKELGETDDRDEEMDLLREKIEKAKMPKAVAAEADKQLKRLSRLHGDSAEAGVVRTYLDWLVELPWTAKTRDKLDLKQAHAVLDEDHFGLEKVKERILEFLAVAKMRGTVKGSILCFVGPPGVGKTSLGRSIARSMGRKFIRVSLGGVRDEAEIRGHRRTYVGAMPGKILMGMKQAGSNNPVFMLDEIDKLGADFRGDPASALLEVLDPEQNDHFTDHYMGVPFDLSRVLFIATANTEHPIPQALHDRMEMIRIPGYTSQEKVNIAERYLIPKQLDATGLTGEQIDFPSRAVMKVVEGYTREAGVRTLERTIGSLCRKVARRIGEGKAEHIAVTPGQVEKLLGPPEYRHEEDEAPGLRVGLATGLAWTPVGGEILHIEAQATPGRGALTLTGHLGEVMRESAQAAVTYARAHAKEIGLVPDFFSTHDIHVHVPAGAIPKDGPSAGIAMVTALVSTLTGIPSKAETGMTGEITLRGRVMPIGGLREKLLGAHRAGLRVVVAPAGNEKDYRDLAPEVRRKVKVHFVKDIDEVLDLVLERSFRKAAAARARKSGNGATKKRAQKAKPATRRQGAKPVVKATRTAKTNGRGRAKGKGNGGEPKRPAAKNNRRKPRTPAERRPEP
ncbi:endopeptidase La [bacterium]|nr:endopeptidase La [bacterium]